ncbi:MAG: hypothetical protein KC910_07100, partial [Candidatus Eremiobacteraeota bacterium]|nr:hypothetical protein [Candidatus Eremiobacteraeota bacterium]
GVFTLALDKARDKLSRFQLHQPHQYVCHLVASGVAAGATRVEVTIDSDDIIVVHDGRPLEAGQLEDLFAALLAPDAPALSEARELAIGLNSALLFEPAWIEVSTASGGFLRMQGSTQKVERRNPLPGAPAVRIHVKERHWRAVKRFFKTPPELEALASGCRYCPVPVVVNGANVAGRFPADNCSFELRLVHPESHLPNLEGQARWAASAQSPGEYAAVIRLHQRDPSLILVVNGLALPAPALVGARIVANLGWLPKNVSQSELLDSEPLLRLRASLREMVEQAYGELARQASEFGEEEVDLCLNHLRFGPQGARGPLMRLPLFRSVDGQRLSGDMLWQHYAARNRLLTWPTVWETELTPPEPVVVCNDQSKPVLNLWFVNLSPANDLFACFRHATTNRRAYLERRPVPLKLFADTLAEMEVTGPGFSGRLGVTGQSVASLTYLRQSKPLGVEAFAQWPEGLVGIFEHPDFRPSWSWEGVDLDCPARAAVVEAVTRAIPELAARLDPARVEAQPFLRGLGLQVSIPQSPPPLLSSTARRGLTNEPYFFEYRSIEGDCWRLLEPPATGLRAGGVVLDFPIPVRTNASGTDQWLRQGAQMAVRACIHRLAELPDNSQRAARRALLVCLQAGRDYFSAGHLAALAEAPLIPLVGGDHLSLRTLPWHGKLEYVTHRVGSPDRPLLEPETAQRLARLLGTEAIDVSEREAFLSRGRQSTQLGPGMLARVRVERADLRGEVGLPITPHDPRIEVRLLVQSRPWGSWLFPCPIAVEACLDLFEWGLVAGSNRLPSQRLARMAVGEAVLEALVEMAGQCQLEGELLDRLQSLALARFCPRFDHLPVFASTDGGWLSLEELRRLKPPLVYSSQAERLPDRKVLALSHQQAARLRAWGLELQSIFSPGQLEANHPGLQWLARLAFEHQGQAAEIGVATTRLPSELLPGIAAVPPGLDAGSLEQPLTLLTEELAAAFPGPDEPGFELARLALLHALDWAQPHLAYEPGLAAARQLRLFPMPGGRLAPLDHLLDEVKAHGYVELAVEGESELGMRLAELFELQAPPAPEPGPRPSRQVASGPELLEAIRQEFRLLSPTFPHHLLERLSLTPLEPGLLCVVADEPLLNSEHILIRELLGNFRPERLYLIVSALFSVLNRALPEVTDGEERAFHQKLLETLH